MSGTVVDFPHMGLGLAREIVARPDLHDGSEIVAACQVLLACGSDEDVRAVMSLQVAGTAAGFDHPRIKSLRFQARRKRREMLIGFFVLAFAVFGASVVAGWLFALAAVIL